MKKNINKIMIITSVSLLLIAISCFISTKINENAIFELIRLNKTAIDTNALTAALGVFGLITSLMISFAYYGILLLIPVLACLVSLAIQLIARLFQIGQQKKWKDITTKVLGWISLVPFIFLIIYIIDVIKEFKVYVHIIPILIIIGAMILIIKNLFNKE